MGKFVNPEFLKKEQYHSAVNLNCRITLHERFSTNATPWSVWIHRHLGLEDGHYILAVGCGNAVQWRENASHFPITSKFALMDLSIGMLSDARNGFPQNEECFQFVNGDAQFLPFPDSFFDRVTANHMLYHVPSIELAVSECARVIKPEGLFMAATNGMNHMTDLYHLLSEFDDAFTPPDIAARRFGLRNGGKYLSKYFHEVRREIYECDLWVTDAQALVNYAFSMWDVQDTIAMEKANAMREFFTCKISVEGGILIRKETGIFLASHTSGLIDSLGILQAEQELS